MFLVASVALMILDQKSIFFQNIRSDLALFVLPIQWSVNLPIKTIQWVVTGVATQQQLLGENARLRAHELILESKLQKLLALERENAQLRELLKSASYIGGEVGVAQLLAVALDPNLQQVVIDKGTDQHVYVGQPALDPYGVIGQVIQTGVLTSKIMLITDSKSAVPVQNNRNGIRAIAVGRGSSEMLELINVPDTSDIAMGDLFVTSGLNLRYPVGYPVGRVTEIIHQPRQRFANIKLQPAAHLNQSRQVLLIWPKEAALATEVQKQLTDSKAIKSGKQ